ncbi:MAG: carboxypeptidase-like regulatory domain-containing protein [Flavobacteriaceae bacterium]|nr:carboxypeptidase-like regulatory domain-containing protein [Mangrovimonas sp.]
MENSFSLNIKTPCSENFNKFKPTSQGGFCDSCKKEVIDFTKMDAQEVAQYFKVKEAKDTCGRFNNHQLTTYPQTPKNKKVLSFISGIGLACLAFFSFGSAQAQGEIVKNPEKKTDSEKIQDQTSEKTIIVKGNVSESSIPLPGVNVVLQGTTTGTATDFDGNFEFPEKLKKGDVLIFSYVGMESKKVVITNEDSAANVELKINMTLDACVLVGKVDVKKVYKSKRK